MKALLNTQALPSENIPSPLYIVYYVVLLSESEMSKLLPLPSRLCLPGLPLKKERARCHPQDRYKLWVPLSLHIPPPAEFCPHQLALPLAWPTPGNPLQDHESRDLDYFPRCN